MSKHTPGPWSQYAHGDQVYGGDGYFITAVQSKNAKADALLIAAAPDLLEALYQCLDSLKALGAEKGYASEAARGAIAKATDQPVQSQTNASIGSA